MGVTESVLDLQVENPVRLVIVVHPNELVAYHVLALNVGTIGDLATKLRNVFNRTHIPSQILVRKTNKPATGGDTFVVSIYVR